MNIPRIKAAFVLSAVLIDAIGPIKTVDNNDDFEVGGRVVKLTAQDTGITGPLPGEETVIYFDPAELAR